MVTLGILALLAQRDQLLGALQFVCRDMNSGGNLSDGTCYLVRAAIAAAETEPGLPDPGKSPVPASPPAPGGATLDTDEVQEMSKQPKGAGKLYPDLEYVYALTGDGKDQRPVLVQAMAVGGITPRQYFAGQALASLRCEDYQTFDEQADDAVSIADALLAKLEVPQ